MRQFKTESKKLLDLMINSIYTNKEIFLRELISNASDAVDKLNFKSLQDPSVKLDQGDLAIRVSFDKDARTITISDNGIGMTAEELERNLGTIAHSGSEEFKTENAEQQGSDVDIIGQFGVGFYSAFMVASHVKVVSRAYGEDVAHVWESDGLEGYTIEDGERAEHGTDVILTLRENEKLDADGEAETYDRFLTEWGLKSLIQQYSNYVRYPIQMMVSKSRQKPKPEDAGDDYTPEYEDYQELETVNSMTPIWKSAAPMSSRRTTTSSTSPRSTTLTILRAPSASMPRARSSMTPCCLCRAAPRSICTARTTRRAWRSTAPTC